MKLDYQILLKSTPKLTDWIRPWPQLRLVECSVMLVMVTTHVQSARHLRS